MAKVLGVGGVFFVTPDGERLRAWYAEVLGIEFGEWGGAIFRPEEAAAHLGAATVFSTFKEGSDYLAPSTKDFLVNLMVDDLDGILARAKAAGVEPVRMFPDEPNGRFAHIMDPEGRKIELWQPKPMS